MQTIVTYRHSRHICAHDGTQGIWNRWPLEETAVTECKLILILRAIESEATELCSFNYKVRERWFRSCNMWSCVVGRVVPDVPEHRSAFTFSLRIKTVQSFETLRNTCLISQRLIPKDLILQQQYCENLNCWVVAVCGVLALNCPYLYQ